MPVRAEGPDMTDSLAGSTFAGKYRVTAELGRGRLGTTYQAVDTTLDWEVALKVLDPDLTGDPGAAARFRDEARAGMAVRHPNLADVYEEGEYEGRTYVVQEYLPGGTLRGRMAARKPFAYADASRIVQAVAAGLEAAHAQGLIHGDVTPGNILFDARGNAVLSDFGLVRALQRPGAVASTSAGAAGTMYYKAPELWQGRPPASPATDVYALGCILYELLAGRPLFGAETLDQVLVRHLVKGPDFDAAWPPAGAPKGLGEVVAQAVARDPKQRYATAGAFAAALADAAARAGLAVPAEDERKRREQREADERARQQRAARYAEKERARQAAEAQAEAKRQADAKRAEEAAARSAAQQAVPPSIARPAAAPPPRHTTTAARPKADRRLVIILSILGVCCLLFFVFPAALALIVPVTGNTATRTAVAVQTRLVEAPVVVEPTRAVEPTQFARVTPTPSTRTGTTPCSQRVQVRWFVGLSNGSQENQVTVEEQVVEDFNKSQDVVCLDLQVAPYESAEQQLQVMIAAGDAPDIIGPVTIGGAAPFHGMWLDLEPYAREYRFDLSDFDPAVIEAHRTEQGLVALPLDAWPLLLYYNRDLFDAAGAAYPPQAFGAPYEGRPWDIDALAELGMQLTLDNRGNNATSAKFDANNIVQYGFAPQWLDARAAAALFGPGSFVGADFKTAQIPDNWREAFRWFYAGIWDGHFIPSDTVVSSDLLGYGNGFAAGHVAITYAGFWYSCCVDVAAPGTVTDWDVAVVPAYRGTYTAGLDTDNFRILDSTQHPDEAFQAMAYLLSAPVAGQLSPIYGGFPARKSLQPAAVTRLEGQFPGNTVNWQVAIESLSYADSPNHEGDLPNHAEAWSRIVAFSSLYGTTPGLSIDDALDALRAELQEIFER